MGAHRAFVKGDEIDEGVESTSMITYAQSQFLAAQGASLPQSQLMQPDVRLDAQPMAHVNTLAHQTMTD